jgi:hypothetical protein
VRGQLVEDESAWMQDPQEGPLLVRVEVQEVPHSPRLHPCLQCADLGRACWRRVTVVPGRGKGMKAAYTDRKEEDSCPLRSGLSRYEPNQSTESHADVMCGHTMRG